MVEVCTPLLDASNMMPEALGPTMAPVREGPLPRGNCNSSHHLELNSENTTFPITLYRSTSLLSPLSLQFLRYPMNRKTIEKGASPKANPSLNLRTWERCMGVHQDVLAVDRDSDGAPATVEDRPTEDRSNRTIEETIDGRE